MKFQKIFITSLFLVLITAATSAQIIFQKKYRGFGHIYGTSAMQTSDGGYILAGYANGYSQNNDYDVFLVKTDSMGDTLWTKFYGIESLDYGFSVKQTFDGGYIITGQISIPTDNYISDVYLIKTDSIGNLEWSKSYGGSYWDFSYSLEQTSDSGFIITGSTESFGSPGVYLIKTDITGNLLWSKIFRLAGNSRGLSVKETFDKGYVIAGWTDLTGVGLNAYLIRTDSSGNLEWSKTFGGAGDDMAQSVYQTNDRGFIITGFTSSFGAGNKDVFLIKMDSIGNILWSKTFGNTNNDLGWSVLQTSDGGYIFTGSSDSFSGLPSSYLIKTDSSGNLLWSKIFGETFSSEFYSVQPTGDNGYVIACYNIIGGAYLIKTDESGNSGCIDSPVATIEDHVTMQVGSPTTFVTSPATLTTIPNTLSGSAAGWVFGCADTLISGMNEAVIDHSVLIYPNPFVNSFSLSGGKKNGEIVIFDLAGKEILRQKISAADTKINAALLINGFYVLRYSEENKSVNIKILKY